LRGRAGLVAAALIAVAIAFFIARPPPTAGPALRDFESYYAAGATWHYEGDPYGRDVWRTEKDVPGVIATRDELLPFVGPPFGLPLWSALSRLSWQQAVVLWEVVLAASLATIAFASLRLAGGAIGALDAVAVLAVAAGFGPLTSGVALGQVAVLACAAIALVPFLLRPRWLAAAFCAALVAALQPNLALALAARLGSRRAWLAFVCAAAVAICGSALALGGPAGFAHYLAVLSAHGAAERFIAIQTTPGAVARALGASGRAAGTAALVLAGVVVSAVAVQCLRGGYAPNARLALASAALPLALPFAHEHDFTIAFLPAVLTVRSARGMAWLTGACGTLLAGTDWLGLAQRRNGVPETALLTLAAALGIAALARGTLRPLHFVPALLALAVVAVGALVATHPLGTWPDGLGLHFHVPFSLQAPEVWRREQEASGIAELQPAWGWLRLLSLAGCALIWFAASFALRDPKVTATR
jgi:hypothetical protein